MGANTLRNESATQPNPTSSVGKGSLFKLIEEKLNFSFIFEEGLPIKYAKQILYVVFLLIIYIANSHWAEKMIRSTDKIKAETSDLRTDYTTLKADYMFASKQSEVAKKVEIMGIKETTEPPTIIKVKDKELK
jgi:hypothetical protein